MFLAYFDESGDPGIKGSQTRFFVLGCVLVHDRDWLPLLDLMIFSKRAIRQRYGIPNTAEIKAVELRQAAGPFRRAGLSRPDCLALYGRMLEWFATKAPVRAFAVAIDKAKCDQRGDDPRRQAWRFALQRVDKFCRAADDRAMIFPDSGHASFIRKLLRRVRRHDAIGAFFGGPVLQIQLGRLVEDPCERLSHESAIIQWADLLSYAAHRSSYVDPRPNVPDDLWDKLDPVLLKEVNSVTGGPPGLVVWPR